MYNEENTIQKTVERLKALADKIVQEYEIIISDDASSDKSALIVGQIAEKNPNVKLVRLVKNTKFGGALKAGIEKAQKEIVVYTDSDLPIDESDIKGALSALGNHDILTACSKIEKGENLKRIVMSRVYNFLVQLLFRTSIRDINSGFKIYKRKIFEGMRIISKSPFVDVEIFVRAMRKGCTITQYPLIFKNRKGGKSYISRPMVVFATLRDMLKFKLLG